MSKCYNSFIYNGKNKSNSKALRRNMTEQERKLWYSFLRDYPVKIYRQRSINNYIVDFYCAKAGLVIEIDGSQHYSDMGEEYDKKRTEELEKLSVKVIRFTNPQIIYHFKDVCAVIDEEIKKRIQNIREGT